MLIVDPRPGEAALTLIEAHGLTRIDALDEAHAQRLETAVIAVKPQILAEVAASNAAALPDDAAILSIMAGPTLSDLAQHFGDRPIVRAMPNTPAAIGKGVSVCVANEAGDALRKPAERLLKVGGPVEWVEDERQLAAVTAVSGSGPAYVFLLAEALAGAARAEGLPEELAQRLARQTLIGAAALLDSGEADAQTLRRAVTSPGGTTQAALDVLMGPGGLPELMRHAVNAAERRARALSGGGR